MTQVTPEMTDEQLAGLERLAQYQARTDSKIVALTSDIVLQYVRDFRIMRQRAEAAEARVAELEAALEAERHAMEDMLNGEYGG